MKQFIIFLIIIFSGLGFFYFKKQDNKPTISSPILKIYADSSFVAKWGPGPDLQNLFQKKPAIKLNLWNQVIWG